MTAFISRVHSWAAEPRTEGRFASEQSVFLVELLRLCVSWLWRMSAESCRESSILRGGEAELRWVTGPGVPVSQSGADFGGQHCLPNPGEQQPHLTLPVWSSEREERKRSGSWVPSLSDRLLKRSFLKRQN